jgi:TonB family protein
MQLILVAAAVMFATAGEVAAQDPLSSAKDMYASAAYEDALAALTRLEGTKPAADVVQQANKYRVFCLYALGRTREAETIAESILRKDPLERLDSAEASPRLQALFNDLRKRLLPSLIRERFKAARAAFDAKEFERAESGLTDTRQMIAEANRIGVSDPGLTDMSVLVDGFLELTRSAATERQPPPMPAVPATSTEVPAETPVDRPTYSAVDQWIVPPVTIDQRIPQITPDMYRVLKAMGEKGVKPKGVVDLVIDETGKVVEVTVRQSLMASFDAILVDAARRWKYQPATRNGSPVRFVKTLMLEP